MKTTLLVVGTDRGTFEEIFRPALPEDLYQLITVESVDEASRVMAERGEAIDAILIDWSVPEVAQLDDKLPGWVQEHAALDDVEVVVHARTFDPGPIDQIMTSGAYYFVTKPYVPAQLAGLIRAAVASCRSKRKVARTIDQMRNVAGLLDEGQFHIRTPADASALAAFLGAACLDPQQGIGFLELLRNAVEHGNLGITYDEKGALLKAGRFKAEIERRLTIDPYGDRFATVAVRSTASALDVEISDQGEGFDFEKYLVMTPDRMFDPNGRGLLLASMCLDLEYFPPGNRVRAIAER